MDIDPEPITNWILLVLAILGVITGVAGVVVKVNKNFEKRVSDLIKETTKPIQPLTNGGLSLSDLHHKIDRIEDRYAKVLEEQQEQRELWHLRYSKDQERVKSEWMAVFLAIKHMIHRPPEEHPAMWDDITEAYINGTIADRYKRRREDHDDA